MHQIDAIIALIAIMQLMYTKVIGYENISQYYSKETISSFILISGNTNTRNFIDAALLTRH